MKKDVVFVWENFGPIHADRCDALGASLDETYRVIGLEIVAKSSEYDWQPENGRNFRKITIFPDCHIKSIPIWRQTFFILRHCLRYFRGTFFLCHYERPSIFMVALALRCLGHRVIVMNDSKFDDYERELWRENLKRIAYLPYTGAIASGVRARDYLRFLGFARERIEVNYNAMNLARIVEQSQAPPAPEGVPFSKRHYTIIARLVPKKNIGLALEALRIYRESGGPPRKLIICGSGQLESELRRRVMDLELNDDVVFVGFIQTEEVSKVLSSTLVLLLPSIEEQFGNVVIEAQAMRVPVILSENCGARDQLIRSGVNGFVVEPDNAAGMAFFMQLLSENEPLWRRMCSAASERNRYGDVAAFVSGIKNHLKGSYNSATRY